VSETQIDLFNFLTATVQTACRRFGDADFAEVVDAAAPKPGKRAPYNGVHRMRTLGIWIFGLLAGGLAGAIVAFALIRPGFDGQFFTFVGGFLTGVFAFACARLWLTTPSKDSN
jgi:hypothetical protein